MDFSQLEEWGYLAIAFFSFGGSFIIVAASAIFAQMGKIDPLLAFVVASLFNFLGDNFLFYLGRYQKSEIKPYFDKHRRVLALARAIMRRYGSGAIVVQKFIYGVKTIVPISMALTPFSFRKFIMVNAIASPLFVGVIGGVSYFLSSYVIAFFDYLKGHVWMGPLFLVAIVGAIYWYISKKIKKS